MLHLFYVYPVLICTISVVESMNSGLTETELKALVSSTLRRQYLLGAVPGAQRLLPVAAFALGDLFAHKWRSNVIENVLCGPDSAPSQVPTLSQSFECVTRNGDTRNTYSKQSLECLPVYVTTIVESCHICSRLNHHCVFPHTVRPASVFGMYGNRPEMHGGNSRRSSLAPLA